MLNSEMTHLAAVVRKAETPTHKTLRQNDWSSRTPGGEKLRVTRPPVRAARDGADKNNNVAMAKAARVGSKKTSVNIPPNDLSIPEEGGAWMTIGPQCLGRHENVTRTDRL